MSQPSSSTTASAVRPVAGLAAASAAATVLAILCLDRQRKEQRRESKRPTQKSSKRTKASAGSAATPGLKGNAVAADSAAGNASETGADGTSEDVISLREKLTVILTTSPVGRHPSTDLIDEVLGSLQLADGVQSCEMFIVCDGYKDTDSNGEPIKESKFRSGIVDAQAASNYEEYKTKLVARYSEDPSSLIKVLELKSRHGFGFAVKTALQHIDTPFVMVLQHDRPFVRHCDIARLLAAMEADERLKYVGLPTTTTLSHQYHVLSKYGIRVNPFKVDAQGLQMLPLIQWYDSTHLCRTDHYKDFVFGPSKLVARGGFIEDKLGQAQLNAIRVEGVEAAHPEYGTFLASGDGFESPVVAHLDGRDALNGSKFRFTRGEDHLQMAVDKEAEEVASNFAKSLKTGETASIESVAARVAESARIRMAEAEALQRRAAAASGKALPQEPPARLNRGPPPPLPAAAAPSIVAAAAVEEAESYGSTAEVSPPAPATPAPAVAVPAKEPPAMPPSNQGSTTTGQTKDYYLENALLQAATRGLGYRATKSLNHRNADGSLAPWGTWVSGVDQGDGWVLVAGKGYLPMYLEGARVLTLRQQPFPPHLKRPNERKGEHLHIAQPAPPPPPSAQHGVPAWDVLGLGSLSALQGLNPWGAPVPFIPTMPTGGRHPAPPGPCFGGGGTNAASSAATVGALLGGATGYETGGRGTSTSSSNHNPSKDRGMSSRDTERWEYIDGSGVVQGPFSTSDMQRWHDRQLLPKDLRVRCQPNDDFIPLMQLFPRPELAFRVPARRPRTRV